MKKIIFTALSLTLGTAWSQPVILPPQVGFIQDQLASFRVIYGFACNFIAGDVSLKNVTSATFSGSFGLLKTDSAILITDAQAQIVATVSAPDGPALFAFSGDRSPALSFLIDSNELLHWDGATFVQTPLDSAALEADAIWSIAAPDPDHAAFLVERQGALWNVRVLLQTGEVDSQTALPGLAAPAFLLANGDVVSTEAAGLIVNKPDGSQVHIPAQLPQSFSLQQMGDGWLQLRDLSNARNFAVRVAKNREGFYALPEVSQ
jgi:hypothetical protein